MGSWRTQWVVAAINNSTSNLRDFLSFLISKITEVEESSTEIAEPAAAAVPMLISNEGLDDGFQIETEQEQNEDQKTENVQDKAETDNEQAETLGNNDNNENRDKEKEPKLSSSSSNEDIDLGFTMFDAPWRAVTPSLPQPPTHRAVTALYTRRNTQKYNAYTRPVSPQSTRSQFSRPQTATSRFLEDDNPYFEGQRGILPEHAPPAKKRSESKVIPIPPEILTPRRQPKLTAPLPLHPPISGETPVTEIVDIPKKELHAVEMFHANFEKSIRKDPTAKSILNLRDIEGRTLIHILAESDTNLPLLKKLAASGWDFEARDLKYNTILHIAAAKGATMILAQFATRHKNLLDLLNAEGMSALHIAIQDSNTQAIRLLIAAGASIHLMTSEKVTPFHIAVMTLRADVMDILLSADPRLDINAPDLEDMTPLHTAVISGNRDIIWKLIKLECDTTLVDKKGHPAIFYADTDEIRKLFEKPIY